MAHPFIAAMERAISLIEENFARKHGLPSPALANEIKKTLAAPVLSMRDALASEPAVLPAHKRRGTWRLESSGEIVEFPKDKYGKTRFLFEATIRLVTQRTWKLPEKQQPNDSQPRMQSPRCGS